MLSVSNTGDFIKRKANLIFDLYRRLSTGQALFPSAVGFLFDREKLSDTEITDIKRNPPAPVEFLPRRLYENYLIHADAISAILNLEDEEREEQVTSEQITEWVTTWKLKETKPVAQDEAEWIVTVDGAKLLKELFWDFSENRVEFRKTRHSKMLTEWLVENDPNSLVELALFLKRFLTSNLE